MTSDPRKAREVRRDYIQALALVWQSQPMYTLGLGILTVIQACMPAAQLWISKLLIDAVAATITGSLDARVGQSYLLMLAGIQGACFVLVSLLGMARGVMHQLLGDLLRNEISLRLIAKTNTLEVSFFESPEFYNKLQNAYQEAGTRPMEVVSGLFSLVQALVTLCSVTFLLLRLHWAVLPLVVASTLPSLLVQNRYGYRSYLMLRERAPELRRQQYCTGVLTSDWWVKEIRLFHLEEYFTTLYRCLFTKFFGENRRLIIKRNGAMVAGSAASTLGWLIAVGFLISRTAGHTITIGDFALYTQAISAAQGQIQLLLGTVSALYANNLFIHNLFEFLSLPARDLAAGERWTEPIDEIEFRGVSFRYPAMDRDVLRNVSFRLRKGESLALVGKNGAGKTTVVKLLCRLYEPTSGSILVNGKDASRYSPESMQRQIAALFQDYGRYHLTARENIGIGQVDSLGDMAAIKAAAQRSGAAPMLEALPKGYETVLGRWFDQGMQLSGGEWQKVALARAYLRRAAFAVLDEPTSSLDAEAEAEIFEDLLHDKEERITLLISHRFSTVRMADQILVLENGGCIESGSHDELIAAAGTYAHLFSLQARGYESTESREEARQAASPDGGEPRQGLQVVSQDLHPNLQATQRA